MKRKLILTIIGSLLLSFLLSSCEEKFMDTKEAGEDYLAEISTQDSIQTLSDVILYKVIYNDPYGQNLNIALLEDDSQMRLKYTAYFLDGTVYEEVNGIPLYINLTYGLQEVLRKMKTGSKWRVWIPQSLCYGSDGLQNDDGSYKVDPYTALYYDIEFLGIIY